MSEKQDKKDAAVDQELSNLLDSALQDFSKDESAAPQQTDKKPTTEPAKTQPDDELQSMDNWTEDFIKEAATQFEANLATMFTDPNSSSNNLTPEEIQQKLQQMAQAAQQCIQQPTQNFNQTSMDFASTISQTLQNLSSIESESNSAATTQPDFLNLFAAQNPAEPENNMFLPFMQGMMQTLLSKDILLPSLKDILAKFPEWLEKNKNDLSKEDLERYENQMKLMQQVCDELEMENEQDSVDNKRERFEKVLVLMQKLQDYGQPPADLVGADSAGLPPMDLNAQDPNQCCLM